MPSEIITPGLKDEAQQKRLPAPLLVPAPIS